MWTWKCLRDFYRTRRTRCPLIFPDQVQARRCALLCKSINRVYSHNSLTSLQHTPGTSLSRMCCSGNIATPLLLSSSRPHIQSYSDCSFNWAPFCGVGDGNTRGTFEAPRLICDSIAALLWLVPDLCFMGRNGRRSANLIPSPVFCLLQLWVQQTYCRRWNNFYSFRPQITELE